jgi:chromosome segregation ATPase
LFFLQQKITDARTSADENLEQKCQSDLEKLEILQDEKKVMEIQSARLKEQLQSLEMKVKESDEQAAKAKDSYARKAEESDEALAGALRKLKESDGNRKDLEEELKKIIGEKQTIETELKRASQNLGKCEADNAELCIIAEELVIKYKEKGLGSVLMGKEPLTQIKRVELEKLAQQYREEIEQRKIRKK